MLNLFPFSGLQLLLNNKQAGVSFPTEVNHRRRLDVLDEATTTPQDQQTYKHQLRSTNRSKKTGVAVATAPLFLGQLTIATQSYNVRSSDLCRAGLIRRTHLLEFIRTEVVNW